MPCTNLERDLAKAILRLADDASMPDSFWQTDSRIALARGVLGISEDQRYDWEDHIGGF